MELIKDNNNNSLKEISAQIIILKYASMKKKSYSVCSSQFRGTFGKDNGKLPKIIRNLS